MAAAAEGLPLGRGYPPLGTVPAVTNGPAMVTDCPGADAAARQVFWLEQRVLMARPAEAADVVAVLAKVLTK